MAKVFGWSKQAKSTMEHPNHTGLFHMYMYMYMYVYMASTCQLHVGSYATSGSDRL